MRDAPGERDACAGSRVRRLADRGARAALLGSESDGAPIRGEIRREVRRGRSIADGLQATVVMCRDVMHDVM